MFTFSYWPCFLGNQTQRRRGCLELLLCVLSSSNCAEISLEKAEASCHAAMSRAFANSWQMKKIMNSIKIRKWLLVLCVCAVCSGENLKVLHQKKKKTQASHHWCGVNTSTLYKSLRSKQWQRITLANVLAASRGRGNESSERAKRVQSPTLPTA